MRALLLGLLFALGCRPDCPVDLDGDVTEEGLTQATDTGQTEQDDPTESAGDGDPVGWDSGGVDTDDAVVEDTDDTNEDDDDEDDDAPDVEEDDEDCDTGWVGSGGDDCGGPPEGGP